MGNEPLTGARYPENEDAVTLSAYYRNLALDLAGFTVPRFATAAARDTAYADWAAAGKTLSDGAMSYDQATDIQRIREGGTWRFQKYSGAVSSANTPVAHIRRIGQSCPNAASITMSQFVVDRPHPAVTVNPTTGVLTLNERGVWSIFGRFLSDGSSAGTSAVTMGIAGAPYPLENTIPRSTGYPGSGTLRQPLTWCGYLEAGSTVTLSAYQSNTAGIALGYDATFVITLIG